MAKVSGNVIARLDQLSSVKTKADIPAFKAGDKVVVNCFIKEGDKERVQAYEGTVIGRRGHGVSETFTVRKISAGVGVERTFPLHSPAIQSVEKKVDGFVRRAKLYYLRELEGKRARIRDRSLKVAESTGVAAKGAKSKTAAANK